MDSDSPVLDKTFFLIFGVLLIFNYPLCSGGSSKYDEWSHFQSEGVTATVYPGLCHYNGTGCNGNWGLGPSVIASDPLFRGNIKTQLQLLSGELCAGLDTNLYRCGIIKLTQTKTWPGQCVKQWSKEISDMLLCNVNMTYIPHI